MAKTVYTQERGLGERVERRRCAECGEVKALMMPKRLSYPEGHNYTGPMYCLSCNPRFDELPTKSFGTVL
jgi:hypothetical protein